MNYDQSVIEDISKYTIGQLEGRADCRVDSDAGKKFLDDVRTDVLDAVNDIDAEDWDREMVQDYSGRAHEIADGSVSVYTFDMWEQFHGVRAWQEEPEFASGGEDMNTLAGYCLYQIARRLVSELSDEILASITDDASVEA